MLVFSLTIALAFLGKLIQADPYIVAPVSLKATNYQRWAHYHWVWLHNGESNQANVTALLQGYKDSNIPVGAVNIDSTWATQFNNFVVDTSKFPDFNGLVNDIHAANMKVILWATSMVNTENPDYDMAVKNQYLLRDSRGVVYPIKWWHGYGGLLDYTNPDALAWWHQQMDLVLDAGVDGFKCDATAPYVLEYSIFGGALGYENKTVTYPDYAKAYYRDFFYYTREKRSAAGTGADAGLVMSRPVDCALDRATKVCTPQSPKDVMFSGWVGDDDATFNGMVGCLRKLIYSSWLGYANFGCDVGGYRGDKNAKDKREFLRWAQAMAFMPLMENGGGGEHRPWMYEDDEVVSTYAKFVNEHHKLNAYMHTNGANAMDEGHSSIIPFDLQSLPHSDIGSGLPFPEPSSFTYRLGQDILVHPVLHDIVDKTELSYVDQDFPDIDDNAETVTYWLDYWHPYMKERMHKSGDKSRTVVPLDGYSVYVRAGALIPLVQKFKPSSDDTDITNRQVMFTWFAPTSAQDVNNKAKFEMRESVVDGAGITATAYFSTPTSIEATISAHEGLPAGLEIVGIEEPTSVDIDAWVFNFCTNKYHSPTKTLTVSCGVIDGGVAIHIQGVTSSMF